MVNYFSESTIEHVKEVFHECYEKTVSDFFYKDVKHLYSCHADEQTYCPEECFLIFLYVLQQILFIKKITHIHQLHFYHVYHYAKKRFYHVTSVLKQDDELNQQLLRLEDRVTNYVYCALAIVHAYYQKTDPNMANLLDLYDADYNIRKRSIILNPYTIDDDVIKSVTELSSDGYLNAQTMIDEIEFFMIWDKALSQQKEQTQGTTIINNYYGPISQVINEQKVDKLNTK